MADFDWQTDEEERWEQIVAERPAAPRPRPWRKLANVWLGLLVLVAAVGGYGYWRVQSYVRQAETNLRDTILSSHQLLLLADETEDEELLGSVLSGRDADWVNGQRVLLHSGQLFGRAPFGVQSNGRAQLLPEHIVLAPELTSATITITQTYTDAFGTAVVWQRPALFRQGNPRWLMSPLEDDFWGREIQQTTTWYDVRYPARDAELLTRLLGDLNQLTRQLCDAPYGFACNPLAEGGRFSIQFSTDPLSLNVFNPAFSNPALYTAQTFPLPTLPTPSLVGLPTDEASYQALLRGYAQNLLPMWIMAHANFPCCDQRNLMLAAVLEQLLAELDVQPWPLTAADYQRYFQQPFRIDSGTLSTADVQDETALVQDNPHMWQARLLALYARRFTAASWAGTVQAVGEAPYTWLFALVPDLTDEEHAVQMRALLVELGLPTITPPVARPKQDLLLLCQASNTDDPSLHTALRYDLGRDTWAAEATLAGWQVQALTILPDDQGFLVAEGSPNRQGTTRLSVAYPDQEITLYTNDAGSTPSQFEWFDFFSTAANTLLYQYPLLSNGSGMESAIFYSLNGTACPAEACALIPLLGPTLLAPNGRWGLTFRTDVREGEPAIYLSQPNGDIVRPLPVAATWPLGWLDNETYFYASATNEDGSTSSFGSQTLYRASVNDETPQTMLTKTHMAQLFPETQTRNEPWNLNTAAAVPNQPEILVQLNNFTARSQAYAFFYNWQTGETTAQLPDLAPNGWALPPHSANTRWLVWQASDPRGYGRQVQVVDLQERRIVYQTVWVGNESSPLSQTLDWSADGQWLMVPNPTYATIVHPATGYSHVILYNQGQTCTDGGWVN